MTHKKIVCIDTRDLAIAKTGAKTYLEEICKQLKNGYPDFTFHFINTWLPVYTGSYNIFKIIEHIRFFFWKQLSLPVICKLKHCDILFCSDYFLPLVKLNFKTVVVFHDAFFWEYPDQYNRLWLLLLNNIGVPAAKKADAVIAMTEYSKKQVIRYVGIRSEKIYVIPLAPKSSAIKQSPRDERTGMGEKYILHVGVLEKRKNLLSLIQAFNLLLQDGFEDFSLALVGNAISKKKIDDSNNIHTLIASLGLQDKVLLPGYLSDDQLAYYYKHASLYAFVSINEGFGIPVLEAFQHNIPVLISDNSCLPEVGGDAVITCNPFDIQDIKEKMKMILQNPFLQKELIEKGQKRLTQFSWQKTTGQLLEIFAKIG